MSKIPEVQRLCWLFQLISVYSRVRKCENKVNFKSSKCYNQGAYKPLIQCNKQNRKSVIVQGLFAVFTFSLRTA